MDWTHVVAAVLVDGAGDILLTRRPEHVHQGGRWEFPGGKVEPGEVPAAALVRELREELGILATGFRPLIQIRHAYPDKAVLLDVWRVHAWRGEARGCEGQPLRRVAPGDLGRYRFPAANLPIVAAARLPDRLLITPEPEAGPAGRAAFLEALAARVAAGAPLVQLRAKTLPAAMLEATARGAVALCRRAGARLVLNGPPELAAAVGADGVHLDGRALAGCRARPVPPGTWLSAAVYDLAQLAAAEAAGADYVVASPVRPTPSHPGAPVLGWDGFARIAGAARVPVYALGGLGLRDLEDAWRHGGQGIAAIRGLWDAPGAGG